jgi:hypothetical protein
MIDRDHLEGAPLLARASTSSTSSNPRMEDSPTATTILSGPRKPLKLREVDGIMKTDAWSVLIRNCGAFAFII